MKRIELNVQKLEHIVPHDAFNMGLIVGMNENQLALLVIELVKKDALDEKVAELLMSVVDSKKKTSESLTGHDLVEKGKTAWSSRAERDAELAKIKAEKVREENNQAKRDLTVIDEDGVPRRQSELDALKKNRELENEN